jgi:hypothetical protein
VSAFGLPTESNGAPAETLPESVEVELIKSLGGFEQKFTGPLVFMARANGWLDDYAREIRRLAWLAYREGQKGKDGYTGL